jgi:hypothetical protein
MTLRDLICRSWILLPTLAGGSALAQEGAADQLAWRCWYDQQTHVTCVLRSAPTRPAAVALPTGLPGVVKELRNRPEAFRNRFVHIPLISSAVDMRFATELARAIMCGSHPACDVSFEAVPPSTAERRTLEARFLEAESDLALFGGLPPEPAPQSD